jgi:RAB protein geranylgeranyltransferase component A
MEANPVNEVKVGILGTGMSESVASTPTSVNVVSVVSVRVSVPLSYN